MITINPLSRTSFYTEIYFNDTLLSTATSFAYKYKGNKYLVTNYHVAFGRNPNTGELLNKFGALPNKFTIMFYNDTFQPMCYTILYPENEIPFKFLSINNTLIDIAVYKLDDKFTGTCINEMSSKIGFPKMDNDIQIHITDTLFVLGYPRGINIQLTPIWKRSSVASEPEIHPQNIPFFYIDTTTREGMSGSPVLFYTNNGTYQTKNTSVIAGGCAYKIMGVYSGRDRNDEPHIAQLGKVWGIQLVDNIIDNQFN